MAAHDQQRLYWALSGNRCNNVSGYDFWLTRTLHTLGKTKGRMLGSWGSITEPSYADSVSSLGVGFGWAG
eukprot:4710724-Amphidinium_carterae.1